MLKLVRVFMSVSVMLVVMVGCVSGSVILWMCWVSGVLSRCVVFISCVVCLVSVVCVSRYIYG